MGRARQAVSRPRNGVWYWRDPLMGGWGFTMRRGGRSHFYGGFISKRGAMRAAYEKRRNFNR